MKLEEAAQAPRELADVTAANTIRTLAVYAAARVKLVGLSLRAGRPNWEAYCAEYTAMAVLRALAEVDPARADEVAREVFAALEDCEAAADDLYQQATGYGIDWAELEPLPEAAQ